VTHSILRLVEDSLGLKAPSMCKIVCECRAICNGKTGCIIKERTKKHQVHQTDLELHHLGQGIQSSRSNGYFQDTMVLSNLPYYTSRIIQEAMHDKFNKEGGSQLSPASNKIIHTVEQRRGCHKDTVPSNPAPD
jgi:hypothetical protein